MHFLANSAKPVCSEKGGIVMVEKKTTSEKVFDVFNHLLMLVLLLITLYPFWYVIMCSVSEPSALVGDKGLMLLPQGFSLASYKSVFENPNIYTGYRTTILVVVLGTTFNVIMTSLGAFVLTRKHFAIRKPMMLLILFTMYFNGGMIPRYLLIYNTLDMGDSIWALILPTAISTYNLIVMRTNFENIPQSLEEAAKIDGASDFLVFCKVIMPLSAPIIAVMVLFYGVDKWNAWFDAMLFMRSREKYPLQLILREILLYNSADTSSTMGGDAGAAEKFMIGEGIRYSTIMVATVPILCVYPFIQKYFVKGVMIGAVKG